MRIDKHQETVGKIKITRAESGFIAEYYEEYANEEGVYHKITEVFYNNRSGIESLLDLVLEKMDLDSEWYQLLRNVRTAENFDELVDEEESYGGIGCDDNEDDTAESFNDAVGETCYCPRCTNEMGMDSTLPESDADGCEC